MSTWRTTLRLAAGSLKVLVTDPAGEDLLKARLPIQPSHPRALLTLLEGAALWSGSPLYAAVSAAARPGSSLASGLFGAALWPTESALVRFDFVGPPRRRRSLRGLGDFRELYLLDARRMTL
ncbi:hypothetical protein H8E07_02810 [bacterium]|nr:hypothetical protein [bacterium]